MQVELCVRGIYATLCGDRACPPLKMQVKLCLAGFPPCNPVFGMVGGARYVLMFINLFGRECMQNFPVLRSLVQNARFESIAFDFLPKLCGKQVLLQFGIPIFARASWKTLVLELWILSFCESLVENDPFAIRDSPFLRELRGKRSFWSSGFSVFAKASWEMFALKAWIFTFCESIVANAALELWILSFCESLVGNVCFESLD